MFTIVKKFILKILSKLRVVLNPNFMEFLINYTMINDDLL